MAADDKQPLREGLAATAMLQVQAYGMLEPYSPPNLGKVNMGAVDYAGTRSFIRIRVES